MLSNKANVPGSSRQTDFALELGAQIRAFVVPNVALLGSVGMRVYIPDSGDSDLLFSGDLTGALGIAYFFM